MPVKVELSGSGGKLFRRQLYEALRESGPQAIGVASAFISVDGFRQMINAISHPREIRCRLVAGIDNAITHPEAPITAKREGWSVRIGQANGGIFHPKLMVGGAHFRRDGSVAAPSFVYAGSSNLTRAGFGGNVECGFLSTGAEIPAGAAAAFGELWRASKAADPKFLKAYSARFAAKNRKRGRIALSDSGVAEAGDLDDISGPGVRRRRVPSSPAIGEEYAIAAWTTLESFTGEYAFQVEFPRAAGRVIRRLTLGAGNSVEVHCSDSIVRRMVFRYYGDNGMFRLNIPNAVPGVEWARQNRSGAAIVTRAPGSNPALSLDVVVPGDTLDDAIARSIALGTWGKTSTRLYGWF